jgi:hypothetical protein
MRYAHGLLAGSISAAGVEPAAPVKDRDRPAGGAAQPEAPGSSRGTGLRIVDDELWLAVQARLKAMRESPGYQRRSRPRSGSSGRGIC